MTERITRLDIQDFKAFSQFTLRMADRNILVGPNNSGKSTILGLFRTLETGIRRGRARKTERVDTPSGRSFGYTLNPDRLGFPLENVRTNYVPTVDPTVVCTLSNRNKLTFHFTDNECVITATSNGVVIDSISRFRMAFRSTSFLYLYSGQWNIRKYASMKKSFNEI